MIRKYKEEKIVWVLATFHHAHATSNLLDNLFSDFNLFYNVWNEPVHCVYIIMYLYSTMQYNAM